MNIGITTAEPHYAKHRPAFDRRSEPAPLHIAYGPNGSQIARLSGDRLHLNHGPIDLVLRAWGKNASVREAYLRAISRFDTILHELCRELPELRRWKGSPNGPIARVMKAAVAPYEDEFITPMAAVAGAVAQDILNELKVEGIDRAFVNNGGDIAIYLAAGAELTCAIAGTGDQVQLRSASPIRGIATSGWGGRSFSFGIADAVTVLARSAAQADAAASIIANATNLPDHAGVRRAPANTLQPDTDLGARLVTTFVPQLSTADIDTALCAGLSVAETLKKRGLIEEAALFLQGEVRTTGTFALSLKEQAHG